MNVVHGQYRFKRLAAAALILCALGSAGLRAGELMDPTRPTSEGIGAVGGRHSGWILESTFVSPARRTALVNGRIVRVGERVNGATVQSIQPYEVRLVKGRRTIVLRMVPKMVKRDVAAKGEK